MVDVSLLDEVARQFVIRGEGTVARVRSSNQRHQSREVSLGAPFTYEQVHPEPQLLAGLVEFGRLVIRAHTGKNVGVEILAAESRGVAVDSLAFSGLYLGQFSFVPEIDARVVH